jgi:putative tricarboxylic transport membrane protein
MENILIAFSNLFNLQYMLVIAGGTLCGILVGILPGLSSVMGLTIMLPITFTLKGEGGILMMLGIFCGAIYGGSITACLLNTPGTANSAATCLDGYPLAVKHGQPGRAIGLSTYASTFGGIFSALCLLWTSPLLAQVALKFSPAEYFGLMIFGISIVTGISGKDVVKSMLGACLGLLLATIGVDSITGVYRFTFDTVFLGGGISFIPVLIGLFAFSQCLVSVEEEFGKEGKLMVSGKIKKILPAFADIKATFPTVIRSSIIGTIVGAIPGTGGDIACWLGYNEARRWSKTPEQFGDGAIAGIVAPESANNAVSGGAMIPLLTLGIPGDAGTAVMLGAFMMQGLIPGPLLFTEQTAKVYTIIFGVFVANIMMGLFGFAGLNLFTKILKIPKVIMTPMIFVFCFVGTYAMNHDMNDITLMIVSGVVGFFILKLNFSIPPIILGLILGRPAEENLRRSLVLSKGDPFVFFQRPISCALIIIAILSLVYPFLLPYIRQKLNRKKKEPQG